VASDGITLERIGKSAPGWFRGLLALALLVGMLAVLRMGFVRTRLPVVVEVDGIPLEVRTHAGTVSEALDQTGLALYPEDIVRPDLDAALVSGSTIRVQRAQPVLLSVDGEVSEIRTHANTVAEFLSQAGVQIGPADEIWLHTEPVEPDTPLDTLIPAHGQRIQGGGLFFARRNEIQDPPALRFQRATSLTLDDGGTRRKLHTTLATVGQVLQEHDVTLFAGDEVVPGLQEPVVEGMSVAIQRSVPVQIRADGRLIRTRTLAEDVVGALGQEGVALVGKDRAKPDLDSPIQADMTIDVTRVREEYAVEFEPIPFETVWVGDPEVEIDNIRLVQEGKVGLTKRRYRILYEDGHEVDRHLEDVWAAQSPITKTMAYGTKIVIRTLDTPDGPIEYWRKMRVYTTSYTARSAGKPKTHPRYGYTRLGWFLTKGIVAVDPDVIPLRTKIYIPGYGVGRAGDTGGGVKGKFVDLGFDEHNYQSWHWWSDVYIMTPVPSRDKIRWVLPDWPRYPDRRR
jgi:uncharacterized protein YabE (DUF348 family)